MFLISKIKPGHTHTHTQKQLSKWVKHRYYYFRISVIMNNQVGIGLTQPYVSCSTSILFRLSWEIVVHLKRPTGSKSLGLCLKKATLSA